MDSVATPLYTTPRLPLNWGYLGLLKVNQGGTMEGSFEVVVRRTHEELYKALFKLA